MCNMHNLQQNLPLREVSVVRTTSCSAGDVDLLVGAECWCTLGTDLLDEELNKTLGFIAMC